MSLARLLPPVLPILTTLIGLGGFTIGIYSFFAPISAAQLYGAQLPASARATISPKKTDDPPSTSEDNTRHVAYIYAHGIRNFVTGLSILSLTAYWQFSPLCQTSPIAALTVQRCLGIVITAGSLTPIVDAYVTWQAGEKGTAGEVGKKAAKVHASRSFVWLVGGLWCLSG